MHGVQGQHRALMASLGGKPARSQQHWKAQSYHSQAGWPCSAPGLKQHSLMHACPVSRGRNATRRGVTCRSRALRPSSAASMRSPPALLSSGFSATAVWGGSARASGSGEGPGAGACPLSTTGVFSRSGKISSGSSSLRAVSPQDVAHNTDFAPCDADRCTGTDSLGRHTIDMANTDAGDDSGGE